MAVQDTSRATLLLRIENTLPDLNRLEQVVGNYIIDNPDKIIYLTVAALAEACGVSEPTVMRTCKKLGFSGYQNLKLTMAQTSAAPSESIHEEVSSTDSIRDVKEKVFQSAVYALQFTRDMLDTGDLEAAARVLLNARKILILGLGASACVAADLHYKLLKLGLDVVCLADPHLQSTLCSHLDDRDAVFSICDSGNSRTVLDITSDARKRGAKIITLTGSSRSALSKLANVSLNTTSSEAKYKNTSLLSCAAAMTVVDSIYTYLTIQRGGPKPL